MWVVTVIVSREDILILKFSSNIEGKLGNNVLKILSQVPSKETLGVLVILSAK